MNRVKLLPVAGQPSQMGPVFESNSHHPSPWSLIPTSSDSECKTLAIGHVGRLRWLMYSQPDFASVESHLEATCRAHGFDVIFLPKFHCEVNFMEQCWGYSKRIYQLKDPSSSEAIMEQNVINSLDAVPLSSMRRYVFKFQLGP